MTVEVSHRARSRPFRLSLLLVPPAIGGPTGPTVTGPSGHAAATGTTGPTGMTGPPAAGPLVRPTARQTGFTAPGLVLRAPPRVCDGPHRAVGSTGVGPTVHRVTGNTGPMGVRPVRPAHCNTGATGPISGHRSGVIIKRQWCGDPDRHRCYIYVPFACHH